ncbi:hypothetical protein ACFPIJ_53670 [Dactylosporangium cerinum]|uniref:HEAT repeat domain-containing protein n=1 Tax=Dactylosporangium cerinum TaxID=1434730 RepID=A0ABV9WHX6_9ACTN
MIDAAALDATVTDAAVAAHQARVDGFLGTGVFRKTIWRYDNAVGRMRGTVAAADDEVAVSVVVVVGDMLRSWRADWCGAALLADLNRRALPWQLTDVALLFRFVDDLDDANVPLMLRAATSAAGRLDRPDRQSLVPLAQAALAGLNRRRSLTSTERSRLRALLRALLADAGAEVDLVHAGDGWGRAALPLLRTAIGAGPLVAHLERAAPTPTTAWFTRAAGLLQATPDGPRLVHDILAAAAGGDPSDFADAAENFEPRWVGPDNALVVRGLIWSTCVLGTDREFGAETAAPPVHSVAALRRAVDERVVHAAIAVLARLGQPGNDALHELRRSVEGPPRTARLIARMLAGSGTP